MRLRDFYDTSADEDGGMDKQPISCKREEEPIQNKDCYMVQSRLLGGEVIIFCILKSALHFLTDKYPWLVIYFPPEIEKLYLYKDDKELIRKVHLVKKEFYRWGAIL